MTLVIRIALLVVLISAQMAAAPALSIIQDVLYRADGKKFNGVAIIEWKSFRTADAANIASQSALVQIVDGVLKVSLAPTTNAPGGAYYSVRYFSGGRLQFSEFWVVPPSTVTLKLSNVRVAGPPLGGAELPPPEQTLIQESDVVGLVEDLEARPVKGPGFAPGRVAFINELGAIEGVSGDFADCVHVDGTAGPCGSTSYDGPAFTDAETPAGPVDGTNAVFTLSQAPLPAASLNLYRNGLLQTSGVDFALDGNIITFFPVSLPQPGDLLVASYRHAVGAASPPSGGLTFALPQVLCSGSGATTSSASLTSLANCAVPPAAVRPGDRLEIRFAYSHQGSATGFTAEVRWGGTLLLSRTAASESQLVGRAEAGVHASGALWSVQSWGTTAALVAGAGDAPDSLSQGVQITFAGKMSSPTSETISLTNFTVIRYPALTAQP